MDRPGSEAALAIQREGILRLEGLETEAQGSAGSGKVV